MLGLGEAQKQWGCVWVFLPNLFTLSHTNIHGQRQHAKKARNGPSLAREAVTCRTRETRVLCLGRKAGGKLGHASGPCSKPTKK
jgi:hypothetical protein